MNFSLYRRSLYADSTDYVFLFKKQFDDKIFKAHRTRIYIKNVDNDYDLVFFILIFYRTSPKIRNSENKKTGSNFHKFEA